MRGCFAPMTHVLKIEVVIPEKERSKEEMSPNGKASPLIYKVNGTARHYHLEDHPIASNPYHNLKDVVEASVCHVKDLENGQMREVDLGCGKALLIKESGEFHAVGHKCPHYGAPLVKGVLSKGRVRCPWHGACFNIGTGDIEDFPGLDSLPRFQVRFLYLLYFFFFVVTQALQTQRRTKVMAKCISLSNYNLSSTNVLIIGAGAAGLVCAETLRQEGFSDRIVMCTMDRHLPYDRPKLSKSMDSHPEQITLRPKDFFCTYDIEVLTEMQVAAVDVKTSDKHLKDQEKLCKGKEMENVFNIRTPEDANRVVKLATSKNVVIVGASFLGMEVAAYLAERAHSVSLVELEHVPFKKFFGERVGRAVMKMFENNRVKFYMQTEVSELREQEGKVSDGLGLPVASPRATIPFFLLMNNKKVNVPHWQMAHMHGRIAALNMLAHGTEISTVPYLWTAMFGKSIRYAGHGEGFDDVVIQGDLDELKFVAFYTKSDEVVAVASMNYDPIVSKVAEVLAAGRTIRKRDVE
uniref:Apoptosis inducing factor mitochondria associated 3 n=1 Tax=Catharus ustulatus TaxID=91951 RepID=A0A8C3UYI1_CATUS